MQRLKISSATNTIDVVCTRQRMTMVTTTRCFSSFLFSPRLRIINEWPVLSRPRLLELAIIPRTSSTTSRTVVRTLAATTTKDNGGENGSSSSSSSGLSLLQILPSVQDALSNQQPVVALESTLLAQGMPYPDNFLLYQRVAALLRDRDVEPATIALRNGICKVGLTTDELHDLAQANNNNNNSNSTSDGSSSIQAQPRRVQKCSTRDLPLVLAQQYQHLQQQQQQQHQQEPSAGGQQQQQGLAQWGATTVASTMVLAHMAGISTFVTGGIGGVHRQGEVTMDVSADLPQLAQTPVVVVSSGIKSILDIGKTLEVLETYSVPVVAYQTNEFPAFFSPHSNVMAPIRMDDAETIALAFVRSQQLNQLSSSGVSSMSYCGNGRGMLVAVPNDDPAGATVEDAIQAALAQAQALGIAGRDVTPFILQQVAERTQGDSLRSNQHLVERNAVVGAEIAKAIAHLQRQEPSSWTPQSGGVGQGQSPPGPPTPQHPSPSAITAITYNNKTSPARIVVMGGTVVDRVAQPHSKLLLQTSNPAAFTESDGGVGRNIAETLGRLGSQPLLYSAVGGGGAVPPKETTSAVVASRDDKDGNATPGAAVVDGTGSLLLQRLREECGVQFTSESMTIVPNAQTPSYLAILDQDGDLYTALCGSTDQEVFPHISIPSVSVLKEAEYFVVDANIPITAADKNNTSTLYQAVQRAHGLGIPVFLEPTSVPKASQIGQSLEIVQHIAMASPNVAELVAMVRGHCDTSDNEIVCIEEDESHIKDYCERLLLRMNHIHDHHLHQENLKEAATFHVMDGEAHLFVTRGAKGVLHAHRQNRTQRERQHEEGVDAANTTTVTDDDNVETVFHNYPVEGLQQKEEEEGGGLVDKDKKTIKEESTVLVANTTGAGDTFVGALLHALLQGQSMDGAIRFGMNASLLSLKCPDRAISPQLSHQKIHNKYIGPAR